MSAFQRWGKIAAIALCVLACFSNASAQSERRIPVGAQPAVIQRMGNELHVFCSGADKNFNGTFEAGDIAASWWILDATTFAVKSSVVFPNSFLDTPPLRPAFTASSVFLYMGGKIRKYSLFSQQVTDSNEVEVPASAGRVSGLFAGTFGATEVLYIVTRPTFNGRGLMYSHFVGSIDTLANKTPDTLGINPQQMFIQYDLTTQSGVQIVLNEGNFGQANSTLDVTSFVNGQPSKTSLNIGDTGNFFLVNGDTAFVVVNGSHSVQIVDLLKKSIVKTISTGTTGGNGPRECTINGDTIFVTTYNSDIRALSMSTGALLKTLPTSGKVDPIIISEGILAAGISNKSDFSGPDSALAVFGLAGGTSVEDENSAIIAASVSPNPVRDNAVISAQFSSEIPSATIEIFNTEGISVGTFTKELANGDLHFDISPNVLKLAQGQYMARISAGKNRSVVPFVVVK